MIGRKTFGVVFAAVDPTKIVYEDNARFLHSLPLE